MLGLPRARWNIETTIQRVPNERDRHSSHSSSASWVPGTVVRPTIPSSQQHFVKKPGFGKAHAQFCPTPSQILNHSTLHQLPDLCWYCIPEKWQLIQKHVEQNWIFSPETKGKKCKRNALADCKRFQSCKRFCYIALIRTVNKQFMGKVEYIKIYSWNNKKKKSHWLMENWPIQPANVSMQVSIFYIMRILMCEVSHHITGVPSQTILLLLVALLTFFLSAFIREKHTAKAYDNTNS